MAQKKYPRTKKMKYDTNTKSIGYYFVKWKKYQRKGGTLSFDKWFRTP